MLSCLFLLAFELICHNRNSENYTYYEDTSHFIKFFDEQRRKYEMKSKEQTYKVNSSIDREKDA